MKALEYRRIALPVLILTALAWYCSARAHVPAASSVDGVYSNPCCGSLTLRDGNVIVGGVQVPFDLENMKFGLTGYPTQRVQVRGSRVEAHPDADPGPLMFANNGKIITVCGDRLCKREYAFKRQ